MRLGVRVGEGCERLHDRLFRNLNVAAIELDEQWAFISKKQKRVKRDDPVSFGDAYVFIALAANAKAVLSYVIGTRSADNTLALAYDLRRRILNRPQITSDGFPAYPDAIDFAFGLDVGFAQLVKVYQATPGNEAAVRYSPGTIRDIETKVVCGNPAIGELVTAALDSPEQPAPASPELPKGMSAARAKGEPTGRKPLKLRVIAGGRNR
jgi:hypothetical protein